MTVSTTPTPTAVTGSRFAWACGLLYPVLLIVGDDVIAQGDEIATDAGSPAEIMQALAAKDTTAFFVGRSIGLISLLALAVFVAALAARMRQQHAHDTLSQVAGIGVAAVVSLQMGAALAQFAAVRSHEDVAPEVVVLVLELSGGFLLAMLPMALVLGAIGLAGIRSRLLGPVLSWSAAVLAVLLVVGFVAFTAGLGIGFLAMPLSWLWFMAAGVRLLASADKPASNGA